MRRLILLVLAAVAFLGLAITNGEAAQISEDNLSQIESLAAESALLKTGIGASEKELEKYSSGVISSLIKARIEVDKLTLSIIGQRITAIKAGTGVDIVAPASLPDAETASAVEAELEKTQKELDEAIAEAAKYSGGMMKTTADMRISTIRGTLALLKQKYLSAKFGLAVPFISVVSQQSPNEKSLGGTLVEGGWEVQRENSAMGDATNIIISKQSSNEPVGLTGPAPASFVIRCHNNETDAYVVGSFFFGIDRPKVEYKIDDEKIIKATWTPSSGGKAVFIPKPISFVKNLLTKDRLIVRLYPYNSAPTEAIFDLDGLEAVLPEVQNACKWPLK